MKRHPERLETDESFLEKGVPLKEFHTKEKPGCPPQGAPSEAEVSSPAGLPYSQVLRRMSLTWPHQAPEDHTKHQPETFST